MIFQRLESVFLGEKKSSPIFKKYFLHANECSNTSKNVRGLSIVLKYAPECLVPLGFMVALLYPFTRSHPLKHPLTPAQPSCSAKNDVCKHIPSEVESLCKSKFVEKLSKVLPFSKKKELFNITPGSEFMGLPAVEEFGAGTGMP